MAYTNSATVRKILSVADSVDLSPFIEDASLIVTDVIGTAPGFNRLRRIETYLTAHLYLMAGNPQLRSEKVGSLSESFAVDVGKYLAGTTYGQSALSMDTTGKLAEYNKQLTDGDKSRKMGVTWLGSDD